MHPLPPLHTHTPYLSLPLSLDHNCIALGAVQKPHHSPEREGGSDAGVRKAWDKWGGVRPMCEKKCLTLNMHYILQKTTKNTTKHTKMWHKFVWEWCEIAGERSAKVQNRVIWYLNAPLANHSFTVFNSYYDLVSLVAFAPPPLIPPLILDYNCIALANHSCTIFTSYYNDLVSLVAFAPLLNPPLSLDYNYIDLSSKSCSFPSPPLNPPLILDHNCMALPTFRHSLYKLLWFTKSCDFWAIDYHLNE